MNAAFQRALEDGDSPTPERVQPGVVARFMRAFGLGTAVALVGLLLGLGILRATNVFGLIPRDGPQIWVRSGCKMAEAAVRAALHSSPDEPVFLIPLDQSSEMTQNACRSTLATLDHQGYRWLRYFPEQWLCQRFADGANEHLGEPIPVPAFYTGGQLICEGLCDGAFERIGRPRLQQFVTVFRPSERS